MVRPSGHTTHRTDRPDGTRPILPMGPVSPMPLAIDCRRAVRWLGWEPGLPREQFLSLNGRGPYVEARPIWPTVLPKRCAGTAADGSCCQNDSVQAAAGEGRHNHGAGATGSHAPISPMSPMPHAC
jgi:hypothetical protein